MKILGIHVLPYEQRAMYGDGTSVRYPIHRIEIGSGDLVIDRSTYSLSQMRMRHAMELSNQSFSQEGNITLGEKNIADVPLIHEDQI